MAESSGLLEKSHHFIVIQKGGSSLTLDRCYVVKMHSPLDSVPSYDCGRHTHRHAT